MPRKVISNEEFKVESGIPTPIGDITALRKYPFSNMQVADSFYIPPRYRVNNIRSAAFQHGKINHMKFSIRRWKDGYRCWRTA